MPTEVGLLAALTDMNFRKSWTIPGLHLHRLVVDTASFFCSINCVSIAGITEKNEMTGTVPTELASLGALENLDLRKLSRPYHDERCMLILTNIWTQGDVT